MLACACKVQVAKKIKKKGAVKRIKLIINKATGVVSVHPSDVGNVKYKFSDSPPPQAILHCKHQWARGNHDEVCCVHVWPNQLSCVQNNEDQQQPGLANDHTPIRCDCAIQEQPQDDVQVF